MELVVPWAELVSLIEPYAPESGRRGQQSFAVQPVFDTQFLAQLVELMVAAGLALPAGKQAVRELLAVVGQQLGDPDRTGLVQCPQKGPCTGGCLVCWRRFKIEPPCRLNFEPGLMANL